MEGLIAFVSYVVQHEMTIVYWFQKVHRVISTHVVSINTQSGVLLKATLTNFWQKRESWKTNFQLEILNVNSNAFDHLK